MFLNYDSYVYAETVYDSTIAPMFEKYKKPIEEMAEVV